MVLDTSAIVAILSNEPERERFIRLIETAPIRRLSAANRVEATLVIEGRKRDPGRADLDLFLSEAEVEIVPLTLEHTELACQAFRRYGRGRHPAGLNFGDVFAYALAKSTDEPLLFKGDDFSKTDIASAA
jgi:ribonuclease VapC